jgi:3-phenylpropionate/trans-cinnamate dioxygenase ferredoxin reductase component
MRSSQTFVIVGAGLAGAKAAETLRFEGFDGRVVLVGEEPYRPYERPPLSKQYLRGERAFEDAAIHPAEFYHRQEIDLRTSTTVRTLDAARREVTFASGERLGYDRLLIATGATPRRLRIPGSELDGVYYLSNLSDADSLRKAITQGSQVVVAGAGWIGAEVAASARQLGASVSLVERGSVPLERVLGKEVGGIYADLHAAHGVDLRFGAGVDALLGSSVVEGVRLSDGTVLPAKVVVVGVGVEPRTELAGHAGLSIDNGIIVDEFLQTSVPGIYAAGDVANVFQPRYGGHIRLEHWSAALHQGPVAALNMLYHKKAYQRVPYFYSDQYDLGMEYRGWAPVFEEVVFRGDVTSGQFLAFWLHEHRVIAAMNANIWDLGDILERLVDVDRTIDSSMLADPDTDLARLTRQASI